RQTVELPVLGDGRDMRVDLVAALAHATHQLPGELARRGADVEAVGEGMQALLGALAAHVELVEHLEGELAPLAPCAHSNWRARFAISIATSAASVPLLPCAPPARSRACSMVLVVRTPSATGRRCTTPMRPSSATTHWAIMSKCGVSPRTTAP